MLAALARLATPATGQVTWLAGSGTVGSADGPGRSASFHRPAGAAIGVRGTLYVADSANNTIRRIAADGMVTTLAGSPGVAGSADGIGRAAHFFHPSGVAIDASGILYVADTGNATIRRIMPDGRVSTLAGSAGALGDADGVGPAAR
ncbi:MAG TPA: SMP-30/gluconolactonase/LRE family protein, partial [Mycobacterium sp.]|nr:SMP-30/gluconolactonase/LRE family protein [Mycobacterium sp.]